MPDEFSVSRDDVDAITAWTVIRAARELARMLAIKLAPLHLTPVEFGILAQLGAADGLNQADLSRAVGVRPQSMTALVASLTSRGLIEIGPGRGRGRRSHITLSNSGRTLLSEAWPIVQESNGWFTQGHHVVSALQPMLHPSPVAGDEILDVEDAT